MHVFNYYADWETEILCCERCGWQGSFYEGVYATFREMMDCQCPKCLDNAARLAIVNFPSQRVTKADWRKLNATEKQDILVREIMDPACWAGLLMEDSDLPDIEEEHIVIIWEFWEKCGKSWTLLKHQETTLWRERAFSGYYPRFEQVVGILKNKYGDNLVDVVPTRKASAFLWGGKRSAPDIIGPVRAGLANDKTRVRRAVSMAASAHAEQTRKQNETPYITHPLEVGRLLKDAGCDEDTIIAGLLHDVVEDTATTLEQVAKAFGDRVAGIVEGCSEPDKSLAWKERKEHTLAYLMTAPLEVRQVVCADKLHNLRTMLEDERAVGNELWKRFNSGKEDQEWYYRGIVESLAHVQLSTFPLYPELISVVDELFGVVLNENVDDDLSELFNAPLLTEARELVIPEDSPIKPDWGLKIFRDGVNPDVALHFYEVSFYEIDFLSPGFYSSMMNHSHKGTVYAVSFDFDDDIFAYILTKVAQKPKQTFGKSLIGNTFPFSAKLPYPITVNSIECYLSEVQHGAHDSFIPLKIAKIS